jgi:hypothetical protein
MDVITNKDARPGGTAGKKAGKNVPGFLQMNPRQIRHGKTTSNLISIQ